MKRPRVNIGDTDLNADWLKYLPEHDGEVEIHRGLGQTGQKGGPGSGHRDHRGVPGQRGGSAPGSSIAALMGEAPIPLNELSNVPRDEYERSGFYGNTKLSRAIDGDIPGGNWAVATRQERGDVKREIAKDITKRVAREEDIGTDDFISEDDVNTFVEQWSRSSNDEDMRSLAIQRDAAKEFGLPLSEFTREGISEAEGNLTIVDDTVDKYMEKYGRDGREALPFGVQASVAREFPPSDDFVRGALERHFQSYYKEQLEAGSPLFSSDKQRRILRAMYDNTQDRLKKMGFKPGDKIDVYRGAALPLPKSIKRGDVIYFVGNSIESWSVAEFVALRFARRNTGGEQWRSVVLRTSIPVEMILSTCLTGFGCLTEGEVTVLGSDGKAEVTEIGVIP